MKTEFQDVNDTRKSLRVEIPSDIVDREINRIADGYSRSARIPGFRPGKAPARVIKQRFKDQILHDVAHELVPRAVDDALRERGVEAVDTPDVRDVTIEEGRPLTFTASFDTVPAFDPGDYSTLSMRRPASSVGEPAVDEALNRLRERAARYEPVEGRGVDHGDAVVVDLERHVGSDKPAEPGQGAAATKDTHENVSVEIGASANPPGFDDQLLGLEVGASKTFTIRFPADHAIKELADRDVDYGVVIKAIKKRVVPVLDDEFAKDVGEFETLEALRTRVREDLEHEARHAAEREVRGALMQQLASRVPFEVPGSLVDREIERRLEDLAGRLVQQGVDPRKAGIDWDAVRDAQRDGAREAVAAALVLDEVARREQLEVTDEELEREVSRYAERSGRTPAAVRARLEKEGDMSRVHAGLRREKSIDFLMARAKISEE